MMDSSKDFDVNVEDSESESTDSDSDHTSKGEKSDSNMFLACQAEVGKDYTAKQCLYLLQDFLSLDLLSLHWLTSMNML